MYLSMFGFIITTHYNNYKLINKCLELLLINIPNKSHVIIYINESTDEKVRNIKQEYVEDGSQTQENEKNKIIRLEGDILYLETVNIDNQNKNGGLTGTWNAGINYLLNKNCKVITLLGHDSFVNASLMESNILNDALESYNKSELKYFGPLCKSEIYTGISLGQDFYRYNQNEFDYLTGFFLVFPINSLLNNRIDENKYFDEDEYPFAGNEVDWHLRFKKLGGEAILNKKCYINHEHARSWLKNEKIKKKNEIIISNLVSKIRNNKINELGFNWKQYLCKNKDLKGITNERDALNHYMSIGKFQNRPI